MKAAAAVAQVHKQMGLESLPVALGVRALEAVEAMTASALIYNSGEGDGFRMIVGSLPKSLNRQQRKLLGFSFLNNNPAKAVDYLKALVVASVDTGAHGFSQEFIEMIQSKPAGD